MTSLEIEINRNIDDVWKYIADIESHVSWMADAVSIKNTSGSVNCEGATYTCLTKVGPLRTIDEMRVTSYRAPSTMEMEHFGRVKGLGTFRLVALDGSKTRFIWEENLKFPWYMGSVFGKAIGMKLLHQIWKGNLRTLKTKIEKEPEGSLST